MVCIEMDFCIGIFIVDTFTQAKEMIIEILREHEQWTHAEYRIQIQGNLSILMNQCNRVEHVNLKCENILSENKFPVN